MDFASRNQINKVIEDIDNKLAELQYDSKNRQINREIIKLRLWKKQLLKDFKKIKLQAAQEF